MIDEGIEIFPNIDVLLQLSMYIELQKEIQAFYPRVPDLAVSKCLKKISIKSSPDILTEVFFT